MLLTLKVVWHFRLLNLLITLPNYNCAESLHSVQLPMGECFEKNSVKLVLLFPRRTPGIKKHCFICSAFYIQRCFPAFCTEARSWKLTGRLLCYQGCTLCHAHEKTAKIRSMYKPLKILNSHILRDKFCYYQATGTEQDFPYNSCSFLLHCQAEELRAGELPHVPNVLW